MNQPKLTVDDQPLSKTLRLSCSFEFNEQDPATQVHVYFYRNGRKLSGIARSAKNSNQIVLSKDGWYRCKARVPRLNLVRWSLLVKYGSPTGEYVDNI